MLNSMKKDRENMKTDQSEIKSAISEINNTLEVWDSRSDEEEDWISVVGDKA